MVRSNGVRYETIRLSSGMTIKVPVDEAGNVVTEESRRRRKGRQERAVADTVLPVPAISPEDIQYKGRSKDPETIRSYQMREALCVEESRTVAERMASDRRFDASDYYSRVQVYDVKTRRYRAPTPAESRRMAEEDRKLFTEGTGRSLSGRRAADSVSRNWAKSNISRLKLSNRMAISIVNGTPPKPNVNTEAKDGRSGRRSRRSSGSRSGIARRGRHGRDSKRCSFSEEGRDMPSPAMHRPGSSSPAWSLSGWSGSATTRRG